MIAGSSAGIALASTALACLAAVIGPGCDTLGPGCAASILVSLEVLRGGVFIATVDSDPDRAWRSVHASLGRAGARFIEAPGQRRRTCAMIDDVRVWIHVEPYDYGRSTIRVFALAGAENREATARDVILGITHELDRSRFR